MMIIYRTVTWFTLWTAMSAAAAAQVPTPPAAGAAPPTTPHATALSEAGEPRAATSPQAEAGEPRAATSATAPTAPAGPQGAAGTAAAGAPAAPAKTPAGPRNSHASAAPAAGGTPKTPANDRMELGVATVTGDREQPKVMYVVPWKRSDIGDLSGKPMNSLLDEALAPVDRDEFKREVVYYQAVQSDASQGGASRVPAKGEK